MLSPDLWVPGLGAAAIRQIGLALGGLSGMRAVNRAFARNGERTLVAGHAVMPQIWVA